MNGGPVPEVRSVPGSGTCRRPGARRDTYGRSAGRRSEPDPKSNRPMATDTLPHLPVYCFAPVDDAEVGVQKIRIFVEGTKEAGRSAAGRLCVDRSRLSRRPRHGDATRKERVRAAPVQHSSRPLASPYRRMTAARSLRSDRGRC